MSWLIATLTSDRDLLLSGLSLAISVALCPLALVMFFRAMASRGRPRLAWLLAAATAFGTGIWADLPAVCPSMRVTVLARESATKRSPVSGCTPAAHGPASRGTRATTSKESASTTVTDEATKFTQYTRLLAR